MTESLPRSITPATSKSSKNAIAEISSIVSQVEIEFENEDSIEKRLDGICQQVEQVDTKVEHLIEIEEDKQKPWETNIFSKCRYRRSYYKVSLPKLYKLLKYCGIFLFALTTLSIIGIAWTYSSYYIPHIWDKYDTTTSNQTSLSINRIFISNDTFVNIPITPNSDTISWCKSKYSKYGNSIAYNKCLVTLYECKDFFSASSDLSAYKRCLRLTECREKVGDIKDFLKCISWERFRDNSEANYGHNRTKEYFEQARQNASYENLIQIIKDIPSHTPIE